MIFTANGQGAPQLGHGWQGAVSLGLQVAVELFNDLVDNNVVDKEDETIDDEMLKTDQHKQNDWQLSFDSQSHSSEHIALRELHSYTL